MRVTILTAQHTQPIVAKYLQDCFEGSRFVARVSEWGYSSLRITDVRLRQKKQYCGSHPGACERGGSHRKMPYLEGADWVEFNDLVNDVMDLHGISANIYSSTCWLRRGEKRRVFYDGFNLQWDKEGRPSEYHDYRWKVAPASTFPPGTPGQYVRIRYTCVG